MCHMGVSNGIENRDREVGQNTATIIQQRSDESLIPGSGGKDGFDN